jgi:hypothetical protein
MSALRLGPLLRYTDGSSATVWVETSRPCTAGAAPTARSFQIAGHHYALVPVTGLTAGTTTTYEVFLDGAQVWPLPGSPFPPSAIHAPGPQGGLDVAFGSCRWASPPAGGDDPVGPDALDALATRLAADPEGERPHVLLLLGDQVYADETSDSTQRWLAGRRDLKEGPGNGVADYEEYTHLYYESWLDPRIRWLLSTVPSFMIFDDHDVIDDWNTSAAWLADMRSTDWWQERLLSGLMSYWVHQHLGNLSLEELAADPVYEAVCEASDGTDVLRTFAARADADAASVRWSYRRDFGRVRLVMVDSRAARVLAEDERAMLDPGGDAWLREQVRDTPEAYDHLLIGTSLPWLLPHLVHDAEGWNAALCGGERGARWARFGEKVRRAADLEHWSAFPASFAGLAELIAGAGRAGDGVRAVRRCAPRLHRRALLARLGSGRPGGAARVLARPQLGPAVDAPGVPHRLERDGTGPRPRPRPARPPPGPAGQLAQDGRPLVRQPAHDTDPARPFGAAAAGAGQGPAGGGAEPDDTPGHRTRPLTTRSA